MCPIVAGDGIDLARFQPPLEFETSFIAAEDTIPWHLWWTFNLFDDHGKNLGQGWGPGIQNVPGKGRAFINTFDFDPTRYAKGPLLNVEFDRELPRQLLTAKPLYMLIQILDPGHLRVGFKAAQADRWMFSKVLDVQAVLGRKIGKIGFPCLASMQGRKGDKGWGVGNSPSYQRFLFDYVKFRYGRSE